MMPLKILLLGRDGQVGWELQRSLAPLGEVIALGRDSQNYCGDLTNLAGLAQTVRAIRPDVIVNAAAHTAVDRAEGEPELAHTINTLAPSVLAQEAKACGAWLVHYSTDYVFDGGGAQARSEFDATSPLNVYGSTKLAGEAAIEASGCKHLIFRTSWVYAERGNIFAKAILKLAQEHKTLSVINDQIGAPTGADLLADVTALTLRQVQQDDRLSGIYHLASLGETSWYEYAKFVTELARDAGVSLKVEPDGILAVPSTDFPTIARRPLNSRLDTSKLRQSFGLHLPHWQVGVRRLLTETLDVNL